MYYMIWPVAKRVVGYEKKKTRRIDLKEDRTSKWELRLRWMYGQDKGTTRKKVMGGSVKGAHMII